MDINHHHQLNKGSGSKEDNDDPVGMEAVLPSESSIEMVGSMMDE
jgi:hypothetical protein